MAGFRHIATIGNLRNLTDLTVGQLGARVVLMGVTHIRGSSTTWQVDGADTAAKLLHSKTYPVDWQHMAAPEAVMLDRPGGRVAVLAAGIYGAAKRAQLLQQDGTQGEIDGTLKASPLPWDMLSAGSFSTAAGASVVWTTRHDTASFSLWRQWGDGKLTAITHTTPLKGLPSDAQIDSVVVARIGGLDMLFSASTRGNFIAAHQLSPNGGVLKAEYLHSTRGTGFNGPRDLVAVEVEGRHYLIVSSAYSSSLTSVRLVPGGSMVPVDHILDERFTRFEAATVMEAVRIDGRSFIVVGGADDGLSLFTITPDGRLIHLDTLADTDGTALRDVSALAVKGIGGRIVVFAASAVETGVSQLVIDPGKVGMTKRVADGAHVGTSGNDLIEGGMNTTRISGGAGDDIIIGGSRAMRMEGGAGRDVFIPTPIAGRVVISDFEVGQDRLDLSLMGMIKSTYQLKFTSQSWGVTIRAGQTRIDVYTKDGRMLNGRNFGDSLFPIAHYQPPDVKKTLLGTAGGDLLRAAAGGSKIVAYGGNDTVFGSSLEDFVQGGAGNDIIYGYDGADTVWSGEGNDTVDGGAMDDIIISGGGNDSLIGGAGNDRLTGQTGNDRQLGGAGNDTLNGGPGNDYLSGDAGNDRVFGLAGNDTLLGGAGDDLLLDTEGDNLFRDLEGHNMMYGGTGRDTMHAGAGNDTLRPGAGDDLLMAGGGNDNIQTSHGNDTVYGQAGADMILGAGGNDSLNGGTGNDSVFGGDGSDSIDGGDGNDMLVGERGNDTIHGGEGDDTLRGHSEKDLLCGGAGNDRMLGGTGHDTLFGENGDDLMLGEGGRDQLTGGDGHDTIDGGWDEDQLWGGDGSDLMMGGGHDDRLWGEAGDDTLSGGDGDDTMQGEEGNDILIGGLGADAMTGGAGADIFVFTSLADAGLPNAEAGPDVVTDFRCGEDQIDLSALKLTVAPGTGFSGAAGELHWMKNGNATVILIDGDGNRTADMSILVMGITTLSLSDFVL